MQAVTVAQNPLAPIRFGQDELDLIKESKCPESTQAEFNLFVYDSASRGLNPLKNEIYFVKRNVFNPKTGKSEGKASHQVGIDGFRIIAQRSGEYQGQTKVEYGEDIEFGGQKVPKYAEIGVMREGFKEPVWARAYFEEYAQSYNGKLGAMWARMPRLMIAKCAEALALRKAFPDCLAGLYTNDEMGQADTPTSTIKEVQVDPAEIEKERKAIKKAKVEEVASEKANDGTIFEFEDLFSQLSKLFEWDDDKKKQTRENLVGNDVKAVDNDKLIKVNIQLANRLQLEKKAIEAESLFNDVHSNSTKNE